jgi:uncharacterized protein (DUF952 family)
MIYHITTKERWNKSAKKGVFTDESLETDGYIHCSSKNQLWLVATFLFKGKKDLVILCIDENRLKSKVIFEDIKRHGSYPHIYGEVNLGSIVKVVNFPVDEDGNFLLPKNL